MAKAGRVKGSKQTKSELERPVRPRRYKHIMLIVCEDEKTEPYYFSLFQSEIPPDTLFLRPVGTGLDPLGVVEQAIREREQLATEFRRSVDETWVVFDKDDADKQQTKTARFHQALQLVGEQHLRLAFSNEVFELWLLLYLTDVEATTAIAREDLYTRLEQALRQHPAFAAFVYEHGKTAVVDAVRQVGDEAAAIGRAEQLSAAHSGKELLNMNPSTQVHKLVQELRAWIAFYSWAPDKKRRSQG